MTVTITENYTATEDGYGHLDRVIGIDLALASTGLALIGGRSNPNLVVTDSVVTKGRRGETYLERRARICRVRDEVRHWLTTSALVVIEGPAGAAPGGSTWDRAGLWWMVVDLAMARMCPVAVVAPTTRAKWATGNGRSDKAAVAVAMSKRAPDVALANSDEADALALAWMGAQRLGWRPVKNKTEQACLDAARWPS